MAQRQRLDQRLIALYPQHSRTQLQSWIMQGKVTVNGVICTKAGTPVADDAIIVLSVDQPKYVGRAGFKLEGALDHFNISVEGAICLDAGLSTGGFTDCLLQRGAARVYGIDVGYGQAHEKIRQDPRVVVMERTNLREVTSLPEKVNVVTLDLSFISVLKVIDAVLSLCASHATIIVLIKPQFEAGKEEVGRGGIVKDSAVHERVIKQVTEGIIARGCKLLGVIPSPIQGADGNQEFLAAFVKN